MLKEIEVSIDSLCLDPNNPRFNSDLNLEAVVPDAEVEGKQSHVFKFFKKGEAASDEDVTNIKDLYESMKTIGFVPIDRVVVRELSDSNDKYLVIEGNRRIATVKRILEDVKAELHPFDRPKERQKIEPLIGSFSPITCMLLSTESLSAEEVAHKISVILGLRHHGSLLEWEPLPKAYSIYKTYMGLEPKINEFKFDGKKRNDVASRLSILPPDVTSALKTYVAYLQLKENYAIQDRHYSLIEAGVTNKHLKGNFIEIDESNYQLNEPSLENMNRVCQFDKRDRVPEGKKKVLNDPKAFRNLGKLFNMQRTAEDQATKSYAKDLIARATDEDDMDTTVEKAVDLLNDFKRSTQWIKALRTEMDKQNKMLTIDTYTGVGNERGNKDALKATMEPLKRMLGI